jgi:hypothetical protein
MTEENAIVIEGEVEGPTSLTPYESPDALLSKANVLLRSGFLPPHIKRPEQAVAIMLRGKELGIGPMEALSSINMIQGKVSSSTQLMLALIYRSGLLEDISMTEGDPSTCTMTRVGMQPHTVEFGSDRAKKMRLMNKDNYKKFPEIMFMWRAIAICARRVFPDVIGAIYTADELGLGLNSDRNIEAEWMEIDMATQEPPTTYQELLTRSSGKKLEDLGGYAAAVGMTREEVVKKWEEWK